MGRRAVILVLVLAGAQMVGAEEQATRREPAGISAVDAVMRERVASGKMVGGVVAVSRNGRIVHLGAYGEMDREAHRPMRTDTIFRIESMSKAIETAAALILYEEGKIKLDDPVSKYIPELAGVQVFHPDGPRAPKRPPTVRDLMLHTSGISYGAGPAPVGAAYRRLDPLNANTLAEMIDRLRQIPLAYEPGTSWSYGLSTNVLTCVVERAAGVPLAEFLKARIFEPLRMPDTSFWVPAEKLERLASKYRRGPYGLVLMENAARSRYAKPLSFSGGGGLVSTASDFMRFLHAIEAGGILDGARILKPQTVKLMTTDQLAPELLPIRLQGKVLEGQGFGFGFAVRKAGAAWDPDAPVDEYGWSGWSSTHYWASPRDRVIVVSLEQTWPFLYETELALKGVIYRWARQHAPEASKPGAAIAERAASRSDPAR